MNIFLIVLVGILTLLFIILLFFYLQKDQNLLEVKTKYSQLQQMEKEFVNVNRQRDDYVAMMVHELRSPLSVIKGSADLVVKEDALSVEQRNTLLLQIKESTTDLLAIVNDILDVSKIESGRFEIIKVASDLNKLLDAETKYYMALAREKNIDVTLDLEESLPEVKFDAERIRHVMNNLISNALKFTESGGKVTVSSKVFDGASVHISVVDNGCGIPDSMKGKLFNKFVQMQGQQVTKEKGTGLGLVIAKGIVEAHGGNIWIEDNKPKGAKFIFTIPLS